MEMLRKAAMKLTAVVVLLLMLMDVGGSFCPPPEDEEVGVDELVYRSDVVVLGKVVRKFPEGMSQLYKAQMRVFCIYKGQNIPRMINISEAGDMSDPCPESQMEVGDMYMFYLYKHGDNVFTPSFPHHPDTYKDEMFILCDLNISRPTGGPIDQTDAEVKCEDDRRDYGEDDYEEPCIRYTPKPGEPRHRGKKAPNQPSKPEKVEGEVKEDSDGENNSGESRPASPFLWSAGVLCATLWTQLS